MKYKLYLYRLMTTRNSSTDNTFF